MRSLRTYALLLLLAALLAACGATPTPLPLAQQSALTPSPAETLVVPTRAPATATATRAATEPPPTDVPTPVPPPAASQPPGPVQITIVYDNTAVEPGLDAEWGFAAWIDHGDQDILFDTGPGGPALLGNLAQLGLDPAEIDLVVLSHEHGDHTGGMMPLLETGVRPVVYVPSSFGSSYKSLLREPTELVEVAGPIEILPGLHSTGELRTTLRGQGGALTEQALVIETDEGSVIVTGCAHPGIVSIVRAAQEVVPGDVALVMGGFHLMDKADRAVEAVATSLRELGVQQVSPTHCTGEQAIAILAAAYGDDYIEGGAGRVYVVGASPTSDQPSGLTPDQVATLRSLQQVGDYPLYVMHYYDQYEPRIYAQEPVGRRPAAWACSLFAALGDGENRLYGRNFDWQFSPALLLFTDPPDGYASGSMVDLAYLGFDDGAVMSLLGQPLDELRPLLDAPHWPFDGMNAQGLVVGMAAVPSGGMRPDPGKPTIGSLGVIREILDHAADVDEALALLQAYNVDMEGGPDLHYLIADRSGRALLVEFYRGQMVITSNEQPWHLATNFITASTASPADAGCWRYNQIEATLSQGVGRLDPVGAMALLSEVSQGNTQWSVVYGMSTGEIQVVMGRQYEGLHAFQLPLLKSTTAP
ncbi:MAG: MBL fold metallo-hydrolase [Anaerolineae bacterium]|jgi:metal-dependent hydrolase (beta-lactamase superfamily II)